MGMRYTTNVTFNGTNLNTLPGVNIVNYDIVQLPSRNLTVSKLARANKSVLTSAEYSTKTVTVSGYVGGNGILEVQENFNRLRGYIQTVEAPLRLQYGTDQVEYTTTLNGVSSSMVGPNYNFVFSFVCSNPVGTSVSLSTLFNNEVITNSSKVIPFNVEGAFYAEPVITLVYTTATGATGGSISVLDAVTNRGIKIEGDFQDGDIVTIDSSTFTVLVNAAPVDFMGQFPTFLPGIRSIQYIDDFSGRSVSVSATYNRKYI